MASKAEKSANKGAESAPRPLRTELWGLILVALGACLFLALVSFSSADRYSESRVVNLIGPVGVQVADLALQSVGLTAFFFDGILLFCGCSLLFGRRLKPSPMELGGYALAVPTGAIFLHLLLDERVLGHRPGGFFGALGAEIGRSLIGQVGTTLVTITALIVAITLISETNPSILVKRLFSAFVRLASAISTRGLSTIRTVALRARTGAGKWWESLKTLPSTVSWRRQTSGEEDQEKEPGEPDKLDVPIEGRRVNVEPVVVNPRPVGREKASKKTSPVVEQGPSSPIAVHIPEALRRKSQPKSQSNLELEARIDTAGFELPSTALLSAPKINNNDIDGEALQRIAAILEQSLSEFKINGQITGITPGPVVTMYEFEPAPGVKLSSISNLSNDLARVIKAQSVRIVAPIPGKGVVGLEVPNEKRETVYLRELLEDKSFKDTRARLAMALGKDIQGNPVLTDLAKMPHLLVAGSTGSGKSVAVNAMITSLLYQSSPKDVRMIMVDPKMLELSIYEGIPHLLIPVVTDPQKAASALKWAVDEMERRYHALSGAKVRDIVGYNTFVDECHAEAEANPEGVEEELPEHMPFIVVVIDEFADLMMVASKDVEICVARLAQKARAAGVHLILATQRPSVDVITGLIKANFPTRMSFRVFSRVDSRTVLDVQGAENLLGMGDMLFRPPGRGDLVRVHGAYVDEKEIDRVVQHLKTQGEPQYREEILAAAENDDEFEDEQVDEMYDMAVQLVTQSRKASISMVQRKLRVGYNRAARMIEMMERESIVSPSDGRGGREVLAPPPPPV